MTQPASVVMIGATGAVGNHTAMTLSKVSGLQRLSLLGRRPAENVVGESVSQHTIDIFNPASYRELLAGHQTAICTLGVGEPSKMDKAQFVRIDRDAVLDFATASKQAGIRHFELLSSVGTNAASKSFYLRTKGQLEEGLKALNFERLSIFRPSMIITPTNRYGLSQAIVLFAMPFIDPLLVGSLRKFRGIPVEQLGGAIAMNLFKDGRGVETMHWAEIRAIYMQG